MWSRVFLKPLLSSIKEVFMKKFDGQNYQITGFCVKDVIELPSWQKGWNVDLAGDHIKLTAIRLSPPSERSNQVFEILPHYSAFLSRFYCYFACVMMRIPTHTSRGCGVILFTKVATGSNWFALVWDCTCAGYAWRPTSPLSTQRCDDPLNVGKRSGESKRGVGTCLHSTARSTFVWTNDFLKLSACITGVVIPCCESLSGITYRIYSCCSASFCHRSSQATLFQQSSGRLRFEPFLVLCGS